MPTSSLTDYFDALDRIKNGTPINVRKGVKITNDAVALEASRKKGSIKKARDSFSDFINAIDVAAAEQAKNSNQFEDKLIKSRLKAEQYRLELEAALGREISLLNELYEVKKQLAQLAGTNVIPLRKI
ncbi:hypothetical protein [Methylomonas sp. 11b]|uniref:hypothetical protein n=1 Tax=Methylomonas sp. 11b TaxID=1168169 RepID=UPI0005615458|nr:hypothetical protein [Methylomonas sp. 11b]